MYRFLFREKLPLLASCGPENGRPRRIHSVHKSSLLALLRGPVTRAPRNTENAGPEVSKSPHPGRSFETSISKIENFRLPVVHCDFSREETGGNGRLMVSVAAQRGHRLKSLPPFAPGPPFLRASVLLKFRSDRCAQIPRGGSEGSLRRGNSVGGKGSLRGCIDFKLRGGAQPSTDHETFIKLMLFVNV